ncbi:uncharacterized protein LOC143468479 [Clavelina lepadiformis]|uniref:RRM domain-containing protein n=1 Tax=Clavelina lepadiformis TaxID=159417 RepID=A0ABP0F4C6_CLALP
MGCGSSTASKVVETSHAPHADKKDTTLPAVVEPGVGGECGQSTAGVKQLGETTISSVDAFNCSLPGTTQHDHWLEGSEKKIEKIRREIDRADDRSDENVRNTSPASESSQSLTSKTEINESDFATNHLSDVVIDSLTSSHNFPGTGESQENKTEDAEKIGLCKNADSPTNQALPSITISPSAGRDEVSQTVNQVQAESTASFDVQALYQDNWDDKKLYRLIKIACQATDYRLLCDDVGYASAMYLPRSMSFTSEMRSSMVDLVAKMPSLKKLDVSGNYAGPVACRALLTALKRYDSLQHLDLSDNMCDSDCTELISSYLATTHKLQVLNLSGNLLGRESLSKSISSALKINQSLVSLSLNACGATNLHGLFEGLRFAVACGTSKLKVLDVSNNQISDGQQLGIDLSLLLEIPSCPIEQLDISDVGLTSSGWDAVVGAMILNSHLKKLTAGGSTNVVRNASDIGKIILSNSNLVELDLGGLKIEETADSVKVEFKKDEFVSTGLCLGKLSLNDCSLSDQFFTQLAILVPGKFYKLMSLNLSLNSDLTEPGMNAVVQLCTENELSSLESLNLSSLNLDYLPLLLKNSFPKLSELILRKTRISLSSLNELADIPQTLQILILDGIKISGSGVLGTLLQSGSKFKLTKLSLCNCALVDSDLQPLCIALARQSPSMETLTSLDLSVNRLTSAAVTDISNSLLCRKSHPLEMINLSNNLLDDEGAGNLASVCMSASCSSNITRVCISHNSLSTSGILALVAAVGTTGRGLHTLDVSNQKKGIQEEELERIAEKIATSIGFDVDALLHEVKHPFPSLPPKFSINLSNLGGSAGTLTRKIDSSAIKTDFSKLCHMNANLTDYLLIAAGLARHHGDGIGPSLSENNAVFTNEEWMTITGKDAPAWLKVSSERRKGVYINHLPGTATIQRLEGLLEMEADCEIGDVFIVKDPVVRKPTGAAWILFNDEDSVDRALDWFGKGEAQMYGALFTVSKLPIHTTDVEKGMDAIAKRELALREKQRQQDEDAGRKMMDESQKLADERAAYREAHPAYQNGRIW